MARADQLVHARGRDRHPALVVLEFLRDTNLHHRSPLLALPATWRHCPAVRFLTDAHPSAFACPGFPEPREATLPGGVRGQDTHGCYTIVQFTREKKLHGPVQRHPGGLQLRLLVPQREAALA